jgi:ribosomal protein S18 acetylase RimI-like enzyme
MEEIQIRQGTVEEAYNASLQIPEFEPWYPWEKWQQRTNGRNVIILIAETGQGIVGFKAGYFEDDCFYSWVGGVLPSYRRMGIAQKLAQMQESLVKEAGSGLIRMKTQNRFRGMLLFALGRGFHVADVERKGDPMSWKITLYKNL